MLSWWNTPNFIYIVGLVHGALVQLPVEDDVQARLYIGGSEVANIEDAPFTVALMILQKDELKAICTGSIISENWVLTAAHCSFLPPSLYWIAAGSNNTDEIGKAFQNLGSVHPTSGTVQLRQVSQVVIHPRYKDGEIFPGRFDFGLCKVLDSWSFGSSINKIGLFDEAWHGDEDPGEEYKFLNCTSFGWGKTGDAATEASPYLRTSVFKIQHGSRACSCFKPYINRRLLCTGTKEKDHSVCPGDSGGPLVCKNKLAGVAHIGYSAGQCLFEPMVGISSGQEISPMQLAIAEICGRTNLISAWMYVCPVLGWIKENVPDSPTPPLSCRSPHLTACSAVTTTFMAASVAVVTLLKAH